MKLNINQIQIQTRRTTHSSLPIRFASRLSGFIRSTPACSASHRQVITIDFRSSDTCRSFSRTTGGNATLSISIVYSVLTTFIAAVFSSCVVSNDAGSKAPSATVYGVSSSFWSKSGPFQDWYTLTISRSHWSSARLSSQLKLS